MSKPVPKDPGIDHMLELVAGLLDEDFARREIAWNLATDQTRYRTTMFISGWMSQMLRNQGTPPGTAVSWWRSRLSRGKK